MDDRQRSTLTIKHSHWTINNSLSSPIGGNAQVTDRNIFNQNISDFSSFLTYSLAELMSLELESVLSKSFTGSSQCYGG